MPTCFEQVFGYGDKSMIAGFVQWRPSGEVFDVDIGSGFNEFAHSSHVAFDARQMQLSFTFLVAFI